MQRRKLRPGRDEGQDLCSGAAYVLTSPIVSQHSASSPGSSAGLLWWGAQSSVLSLQPRPLAPPTPFLLSQVVQTRGLGIHVEFQRHVDSPEEGPPPRPEGLWGTVASGATLLICPCSQPDGTEREGDVYRAEEIQHGPCQGTYPGEGTWIPPQWAAGWPQEGDVGLIKVYS